MRMEEKSFSRQGLSSTQTDGCPLADERFRSKLLLDYMDSKTVSCT